MGKEMRGKYVLIILLTYIIYIAYYNEQGQPIYSITDDKCIELEEWQEVDQETLKPIKEESS